MNPRAWELKRNFQNNTNFFSYGTFEDELIEQISKYEEYIDDLLSLKNHFFRLFPYYYNSRFFQTPHKTLKKKRSPDIGEHEIREHIMKTLSVDQFYEDMNKIFSGQLRKRKFSEQVYHKLLQENFKKYIGKITFI